MDHLPADSSLWGAGAEAQTGLSPVVKEQVIFPKVKNEHMDKPLSPRSTGEQTIIKERR